MRKNILDDARCEVCGQEDETADHIIISGCSFVRGFWSRSGWAPEEIAKTTELWQTRPPTRMHQSVAHPLILLYCWEIWKHRNEVVFRHMEPSVDRLITACKEAGRSWSCRLPKRDTTMAERWSTALDM